MFKQYKKANNANFRSFEKPLIDRTILILKAYEENSRKSNVPPDQNCQLCLVSSGSSGRVGGGGSGTRKMKSMRPPLAAIFFMTYFYRAGERYGPPPRPRLLTCEKLDCYGFSE